MDVKGKLTLLLLVVGVVFVFDRQTCRAMDKPWQQEQMELEQQWKNVRQMPQEIPEEISAKLKDIELLSARPDSPLVRIAEQINQLLTKEDVEPQEIEALRIRLDEMADNLRTESERAEYDRLSEKLAIIHRYTIPMVELKDKVHELDDLMQRSNKIYKQVNRSEGKATVLNYVLSGGFGLSFITNLVALFSSMIKMPNTKLERQLKELQIAEKMAELEQRGIDTKSIG